MDYSTITVRRDGHLLIATIDRADSPLNAVDAHLHHDLTSLFADLRTESAARAIVLTGQGSAFSAGGDFGWFPTLQDPDTSESLRRDARRLIWDLVDIQIPIVAAINGHAMGLGATIALLCDVIFMADTATIGDPHVRAEIVAGDGGTAIWPLLVGPARAKQYLLTGDPLDAQEAERIGLVTHVRPADSVLEEAIAFARRIAEGPPLAVQYTKLAVNQLIKDALRSAFDVATPYEMLTFKSADHLEALAAWQEKRPPNYEGR